jgi:hypothetical protein
MAASSGTPSAFSTRGVVVLLKSSQASAPPDFGPQRGNGPTVFAHACKLGLEASSRSGRIQRSGRSPDWLKMKNTDAPAVKREEEDWGK